MNAKRLGSILLQVPAILILVASIGAGFYAASQNIAGITISTPITLLIVLIMYFSGRYLGKMKREKDLEDNGGTEEK